MNGSYYKNLEYKLWGALFVFLVLNFLFWAYAKPIQEKWINVPPVPSDFTASSFGLWDKSFAYRINAIMVQNLGDMGGRTEPLKAYNYETLSNWFFLQDRLDKTSGHIPYIAAYYFGGVNEPEKLPPLIDYLVHAGNSTQGEKWRFLARAAYLARFKMKDLDRAKEIAQILVNLDTTLPGWAYKMPALIALEENDKAAAYAIMVETLKSTAENLHPEEVFDMRHTICTRILEPDEAIKNPLCENIDL